MKRFCRAFLFMIAFSACLRADCQPNKDLRKTKIGGIEVVDVSFSGATTVDWADLGEISQALIGSCFDERGLKFDERIYHLFHQAGYTSVNIENLRIEPVTRAIEPVPVRVTGNVIEGQKCPTDARGAYEFLLGHRSNSLEVDPQCVYSAFAVLSFTARFQHSRFYTKATVDLLDFVRNDEHDSNLWTLSSRYPAINYLDFPAAIPYLVDAIKRSGTELVRTNAAAAIHLNYRSCISAAVSMLKREAEKPGRTFDERERLQSAEIYVNELSGGPGLCKSIHGEPITEEEAQRELDTRPE